jgi:hypothetical protein
VPDPAAQHASAGDALPGRLQVDGVFSVPDFGGTKHLPADFVGLSLVLWRLVLYFVPMLVGGVLVAKRIGRRGFAARTWESDEGETAESP